MATSVKCPTPGSYIVYDSYVPFGHTPASGGCAVYRYDVASKFGAPRTWWSCEEHETQHPRECRHVRLAKEGG